jgi:hypothetical protein
MAKKIILLVVMGLFSLTTGLHAQVGDIAKELGKLSPSKQIQAFKQQGIDMKANGFPMPGESQSECIAGLYPVQMLGLSTLNQWFIYNFIWTGKTFHEDCSKPCCDYANPKGHYYLTNSLKTIFKLLALVPNGTKAWVYVQETESWVKDKMPTIFINYGPSIWFSWWIHDEIRYAGQNPDGTVCYNGIMWAFLGPFKMPVACFIPDRVVPSQCGRIYVNQ